MNIRVSLAIIGIFGIGVLTGYFVTTFDDTTRHREEGATSKQIRQIGSYVYTNPLLECEVAEGSIDSRKENFRDELEEYVTSLKKESGLTEIALYFRDLNNGPAFGVDEAGEFFPASLLKVPVMMTFYRWAEQEHHLLESEILYEKPFDLGFTPTIIPREEIIPGQSYTIDELIRRIIVYSDNQALFLLTSRLPKEKLHDLFSMLGVGEDVLYKTDGKLTVKEYAGFFRILFNSSYLSRENSEKALALLSSTDYKDALPAGVPSDMAVAHKFGEAGTQNLERQLHDCGIVYFPNHPYLACIMTRGHNIEKMRQAIVDTSRFIYDRVDAQY